MIALAESGGVLGLYTGLARPDGEQPYDSVPRSEMDKVIAAIQYSVDVTGIDGVAIGTHFNTASMPWITEGLMLAGYSDEHIAMIMGGNYIRVLNQVLPSGEMVGTA